MMVAVEVVTKTAMMVASLNVAVFSLLVATLMVMPS